jgi:hypothetical protein
MNPALPVADAEASRQKLEASGRNGANWFFWIAGLSLINSVIIATGGDINFIFGLGITLLFDGVAQESGAGAGGALAAILVNSVIASVFVVFGLLARRQKNWAFVIGMLLYALDGAIFLLAGLWLNVAAHAFALYFIWGGLAAYRQLAQFNARTGPAPIPAG